MAQTLYMVVEHFRDADAVYRRFAEFGRMTPDGLQYVSSWVDSGMRCCFQLMATDERSLLDLWIAKWSDVIDFEVFAVLSSEEALQKAGR